MEYTPVLHQISFWMQSTGSYLVCSISGCRLFSNKDMQRKGSSSLYSHHFARSRRDVSYNIEKEERARLAVVGLPVKLRRLSTKLHALVARGPFGDLNALSL